MLNAQSSAIKNIVIVGGGSAGWMTAAALSSLLPAESVVITLVESDAIGTVGVGEATIPDIINFNRLLGIDEKSFMQATDATFKLGIEFVDWGNVGERYFHPFGTHGVDMGGIDFHQYWLSLHAKGDQTPLEDYCLCTVAAHANKFTLPIGDPRSVLSQMRYAYHFDATKYAKFLRIFAEKRGVNRLEGRIEAVQKNTETGFIENVVLDDGQKIAGDMFFDCSGFRALLIGEALGVGYKDWAHWLPCDTAQTVACAHDGPLKPYTMASAKAAGWQWRIPTQARTGNGHIYSSVYQDDATASQVLLDGIDGAPLGEPRKISFKTGCREHFWEKNCIAVGLSGGFLEPLESTSLFLIQEGISKFISLFPQKNMSPVSRAEYNRQISTKFEQVRDFIILHYKATEREDTAFWRYCKNMDIPETLQHKMDLFKEAGRAFRYEDELFTKTNWSAVMLGQNIMPRSVDPIVAAMDPAQIAHSLGSMRAAMEKATVAMPTHKAFLAGYAPARAT